MHSDMPPEMTGVDFLRRQERILHNEKAALPTPNEKERNPLNRSSLYCYIKPALDHVMERMYPGLYSGELVAKSKANPFFTLFDFYWQRAVSHFPDSMVGTRDQLYEIEPNLPAQFYEFPGAGVIHDYSNRQEAGQDGSLESYVVDRMQSPFSFCFEGPVGPFADQVKIQKIVGLEMGLFTRDLWLASLKSDQQRRM